MALDAATGKADWGPILVGGNGAAEATYDAGRLFVGDRSGMLTALDAATGVQDWITQLPGQSTFTSAPTAYAGRVYDGGAGSGGTLYAVDESSGALLWTGSVMNGDDSSPAVTDTGVYVSYACEQAYDFDPAGGGQLWHHSTSCEGGGGASPVYHSGRVYVRDSTVTTPAILDGQTGDLVGTFNATSPPAFDGSTGFYLDNGTLNAVDLSTNQVMWTYGNGTSTPVVANGLVYEGLSDGTVVALDEKSGTQVWSGDAGAPINSGNDFDRGAFLPGNAVAENKLFVAASSRLTAFSPTLATPTPAFTPSPPPLPGLASTQIQAYPAVGQLQVGGSSIYFPNLRATLTSNGAPVAGEPVTFTASGVAMCTAVTNAVGTATCSGAIREAKVILADGYWANFAGDSRYTASRAHGPLLITTV
jgi:outer membrane protein assembly factor BamB